jgi:outer membrane protein OmpU
MRKLLLATTALVGVAAFAGAAQAASESPITVTLGGSVDFRAGFMSENNGNGNLITAGTQHNERDFNTVWQLRVDAMGKASNGIEYGATVNFWNDADYIDDVIAPAVGGTAGNIRTNQAYVWLSSAWGKVMMGDHHGASDLFVYAPTVGAGQVDGIYTDFTSQRTLSVFMPSYVDNLEDSTKVTYTSPKLGNENHKVQVAASYTPFMFDNDTSVQLNQTLAANALYRDAFEFAGQYTGNWWNVGTVLSFNLTTADGSNALMNYNLKDFTQWGLGGQMMYAGFTVGGSYVDAGSFGAGQSAQANQTREQNVWTVGAKYEFDKAAVAFNYLQGKGYYNGFGAINQGVNSAGNTNTANYVNRYRAYAFGGTYTWFPGMTSALDAVLFSQRRADVVGLAATAKNSGHVVVLSQKMTF